jgi:hypothetical protein
MTDPAAPAGDPAGAGPTTSADLAWALAQMSGLLLSRETVQTALELVSTLAGTITAGTGPALDGGDTGSPPNDPGILVTSGRWSHPALTRAARAGP